MHVKCSERAALRQVCVPYVSLEKETLELFVGLFECSQLNVVLRGPLSRNSLNVVDYKCGVHYVVDFLE